MQGRAKPHLAGPGPILQVFLPALLPGRASAAPDSMGALHDHRPGVGCHAMMAVERRWEVEMEQAVRQSSGSYRRKVFASLLAVMGICAGLFVTATPAQAASLCAIDYKIVAVSIKYKGCARNI